METLSTADGLPLHLHRWPAAGAASGVPAGAAPATAPGQVLIVHGLGEHGGRYARVAAALNSAGWQVHAHDQRGHGRSGGERGALPHAEALLEDLARVIDHLRVPGGRFVLLGHSMGGLVAARFVAEGLAPQPAAWSRPVDALVLSSPALDPGMTRFQMLQLALAEKMAPDFALGNGLKPQWVSRDPAVVRAYEADPLVHDRLTPRLVRFIVDGGELVRAQAPNWAVPTLLMWAGADRCVAPSGSAEMAAAAPPAVLAHREFPGLAHEIFNEPERDEVLAHLVGWLAAGAGTPAPAGRSGH